MNLEKQLALQNRMVLELGINLVNCGSCGDVMLCDITEDVVSCPYCGFESEHCNFPDFFYEGMN